VQMRMKGDCHIMDSRMLERTPFRGAKSARPSDGLPTASGHSQASAVSAAFD
jgi:hypothetical protein